MSKHMKLVLLVHFGHRFIEDDTVCSCNGSLQMVEHDVRRRLSTCMCVMCMCRHKMFVLSTGEYIGYHSPHDISNTARLLNLIRIRQQC